MTYPKRNFLFLNVGHLLDHFFMLIFTTAVLTMESEFADSYGRLLLLTTWSFFFFGGASLPAGWLGDKWSKPGMMLVFFFGIGTASILTGFSETPLHVEIGLALVGVFAAIYHPVGLAMVVSDAARVGRALAINGVWGNMGVALAALLTGGIAELYGWRAAFIMPGVISIAIGVLYAFHLMAENPEAAAAAKKKAMAAIPVGVQKRAFLFLIVAPMLGGLIFNATTISLPKIMDERLDALFDGTSEIGMITAIVFACAALAQLVVGELLDRYSTKKIYVFLVGAQLVMSSLAIAAAGWNSVFVALLLMLATFGLIPVNDWIVAHFISSEFRSRVYAVKSVLALGVGAIAVQVSGRLHEQTGSFDALFIVMAGCAATVLVAAIFLIPARRSAEHGTAAAE
jgi:MFS family permease